MTGDQFVILGRGGGKTHRALQWLVTRGGDPDETRLLLVHSAAEAERIRRLLVETFGHMPRPIIVCTPREYMRGASLGLHAVTVGIDNLELVLPQLLQAGDRLGKVTLTP